MRGETGFPGQKRIDSLTIVPMLHPTPSYSA
jgi:hypothetical protein